MNSTYAETIRKPNGQQLLLSFQEQMFDLVCVIFQGNLQRKYTDPLRTLISITLHLSLCVSSVYQP